jgi:dipeptidyl aminopeptidase/acylaminoacyl peptidase
MNLDDMAVFRNVTQATISPDGRQVAYVMTLPGSDGNKGILTTQLWLLDVASSKSRRLTAASNAGNLAWSPDSRSLAYIGSREDRPQVWINAVSSDSERALDPREPGTNSSRKQTAYAFAWSPSGDRIACVAGHAEAPPAGAPAPTPKVLIMGVSPELSMNSHIDPDAFLEIVDVASGSARRISRPPVVAGSYYQSVVWSQDGRKVLFAGRDRDMGPEDSDDMVQRDVFVADVSAGTAENLGGTKGFDAYPVWAPGNDAVLFLGTDSTTSYAYSSALRRLDLKTRRVITMVDGIDAPGRLSLKVLPKRNELLVTRLELANQRLYRISLASGKAELVNPPGMNVVDFSVAADQETVALVLSSANEPPEIYLGSLSGGKFRKATDLFHDERERFAFASVEQIRWPSKDGRFQIDGFLMKPHDFDPARRYPLIVNIHGGPAGDYRNDFESLRFWVGYHSQMEYYAAHGYLILLPNHRGGVSNVAGPAFGDALRGHHTDSFELDIEPGVDFLLRRGYVDENRMALIGASYGGYETAWGITQTNRYKAASVNDSMFNMVSFYGVSFPIYRNYAHFYMGGSPLQEMQKYIDESPLFHADRIETPVLIRCGNTDGTLLPYLFHEESLQLYAALSERGVPVELIVHPFEGHGIFDLETAKDYAVRNLDWFNFWLSGTEDPDPAKAEEYRRWKALRARWTAGSGRAAAGG